MRADRFKFLYVAGPCLFFSDTRLDKGDEIRLYWIEQARTFGFPRVQEGRNQWVRYSECDESDLIPLIPDEVLAALMAQSIRNRQNVR